MNAKLLGASLLSVLETYCDNSVYTLINDEEKLLLTEFITLGKSGNHRLLQDPDLQRFMLNDQITGRQLIQFAPKMDFYLSSSRVRKVHELMSFGQLSIEQILKLPFVVFSDYCIDLVYFFKKGILTNAHFEKAAATAGFMVNTLCNVGVGALIKQGKLSVEQIVRAQHRIEHDIIRNAAVQKFISAGKLTSEFALVLARIVSSKNNGLNATDIKQLISNRELNIEHIISLTEFDGWRTFKSEIATANTLLAPAQHYSYISGAILPALDFNGESKGVVYGWWDSVPEIDSITHEPIFTYRLYQEIEYEDIEIGSAQFYGQKSFCQLGNEHNIIKTTGIFSQFPINSSNALETCEVLPPTFLERMIHSATQSAKHGAVRGIANVANYALTRSHQPKHVVKTAEFALYFSGLLLMTTYDNLNTFKNDRFPDVMTQSIFNTLIFMMTNLLIQFVCYGIKNLGEIAIQKEWRKTGEELIQLSRYASFGIYALNAKQNGVAMTMANIAAGSVSQFAVEKMGKTIVDYAFSR